MATVDDCVCNWGVRCGGCGVEVVVWRLWDEKVTYYDEKGG